MSKLLIVTEDQRAFDELRDVLRNDDIEFLTPREAKVEIPAESGATFEQNAMDIADHAARESGLVTVAESSGIVVDALDGAPGVSSARYAGTNATEAQNRAELLEDVRHANSQSRSARLVSAVGVAHPDGRLQSFTNTLEGVVANEERGIEGIGYEPIFELDDGMTIAELLPDARERIHPRMVAFAEAQPFINELLAGQDA